MNPYEILGVPRNASKEDIRAAFRAKAVQYHPDKTNGDKEKEETFKSINEAYSILSDSKKKEEYDLFGTVSDGQGAGPSAAHGFPFGPGGDPFSEMFAKVFTGGAFGFGGVHGDPPGPCPKRADVIGIPLTVNDMFNGTTKKVEFEMMDKCQRCTGTGAADPASIVKCKTCAGQGTIQQALNAFMIAQVTCPSCSGAGEMRMGKACPGCKGSKTSYRKRAFELNLPKGINSKPEMRIENKGAYNPESDTYNDIIFQFKYHISPPYSIDESSGNVTYTHDITIDELIGGFEHNIPIYTNYTITLSSVYYFNPDTKAVKIPEKGMFVPEKNKQGDLIINFRVNWTEGEKLIKYREVFQKIYKRQKDNKTTSSEHATFYVTSDVEKK